MRFRFGRKATAGAAASASGNRAAAADGNRPASFPLAAAGAESADGGSGGALIDASPDRYGTENGGSKDESFFEARPWLDSDSEDDFQSVRGDFTPSRGSTPDHPMQTSFAAWMSVDQLKPSLIEKKQGLLELLQEKQQFDDEHDSITDAGSEMGMNSIVHAEEHVKPPGRREKAEKSPRPGCLPCSLKCCWKRKKAERLAN